MWLWDVEAPHFLHNRLTDGGKVACHTFTQARIIFVEHWVDSKETFRLEQT
jgi:hypothetical protein